MSATTPAHTLAALAPAVVVGGVSINSPPMVSFSIADASNNPIIGLGYRKGDSGKCTSRTGATTFPVVGQLANLSFSLAKYVPGTAVAGTTTTTPGKWVNYIVTNTATYTSATDKTVVAPTDLTTPSTDSQGTLTDYKNGVYTYQFYRDITKVKAEVAAQTVPSTKNKADLGDLTYDPNALHRLTIAISGDVWGTGSQSADCTATGVTAKAMANPINVIYDFIPATGKAVATTDTTVQQRLIVDKLSCNECHGKLGGIPNTESVGFHSGGRYDPKYCVVCHTDQRKYGQTAATSTNYVFTASSTAVADGVTIGDFPVLIHRVHKGEGLKKTGYNYGGVLLNETRYPQDYRNCVKCHDGTSPKVAPQANNYKNVPSRLACGACHDGIDFAAGTGKKNDGTLTGHAGGKQLDDSKCALCHDAKSIQTVYHVPVTKPASNILSTVDGNNNTNAAYIASNTANLPSGAIKVTYDILSVGRDANKNPTMKFKMLQDGTAVPFKTYSAGVTTEIWDNFMGSPSVYFVWAEKQDGIVPADFNASASGYIRSLWNGLYAANAAASAKGTLSATPDSAGYYTATLTGVTISDDAVMLTGGVGYTYGLLTTTPLTQTNLTAYPTAAATATYTECTSTSTGTPTCGTASMPNKTGGLIVIAPDVQKVGTGAGAGKAGVTTAAYSGRRAIVSDALCNACHLEVGAFAEEAFHAGQRNDGTTCAWCHTPNRTSQGWSVDSTSFIHAIHAKAKRTNKFTYDATAATSATAPTAGFFGIEYPGILSKCETCHLAGTYDFSATASAAALPYRLYRTVATGSYKTSSTAPYTLLNTKGVAGTADGVACTAATSTTKPGTALSEAQYSPYVSKSTSTGVVDYGTGYTYNVLATAGTSLIANTPACAPTSTLAGVSTAPADLTYVNYTIPAKTAREAMASTLVISPIATACFSCHDSATAKSHMEGLGGATIYGARGTAATSTAAATGALAKAESCLLCHGTGKAQDIKTVHAK
ncbi:MAG: OmcA/MtrC family decaheme c-type cytochrome [Proteobacteria bacterium]|nr:OmcA/MtrC family decaheme c-type cytochrome [Pseudomonadota bacterium]